MGCAADSPMAPQGRTACLHMAKRAGQFNRMAPHASIGRHELFSVSAFCCAQKRETKIEKMLDVNRTAMQRKMFDVCVLHQAVP